MATKKDNVQNSGRIYYVEPNNMYNDMPNGIPHPYEDYCISVDLTIETADRWNCGDEKGKRAYTFGSDKGTISFIGGTNGYLTTNYTDIQNTSPNKNTNECLGIESINISYNSWYVPQVDIRFVDVRGASLMQAQEYGHNTTIKSDIATQNYSDTKIGGGSFFKSLFSFPYPMFKLKVKGFYGKEVTYNLCVETFNSDFDCEHGNFIVDVKFIGYMYGVYTDIPMNYLMIAPYTSEGMNYWTNNNNFYYKGGSNNKIYTYPDLRRVIANLKPEDIDLADKEQSSSLSSLKMDCQGLRDINSYLTTGLNSHYLSYGFTNINGKYYVMAIAKDYVRYDSESRNETELIEEQNKYADYGYKNVYDFINGLQQKINRYNDGKEAVMQLDVDFGKLGFGTEHYAEIKQDKLKPEGKTKITVREFVSSFITGEEYIDAYTNWLNDSLKGLNGKITVIGMTLVPEWIGNINEKISSVESSIKEIEEKIVSNRSVNISKALGFPVCVGNAFRMAFAHMDTFMHVFDAYLQKIKGKRGSGERSPRALGINVNNTDLPQSFGEGNDVPPFTMFYKDTDGKKKQPIWPGSLNNGHKLGEVEFVEELLNASQMCAKQYLNIEKMLEASKKSKEGETSSTYTFIPLTNYDISHKGSINPYAYISSIPNYSQASQHIMMTFVRRLYYWYMLKGEGADITSAVEIEANNVRAGHPTYTDEIKDFVQGEGYGDYLTWLTKSNNYVYDLGYNFFNGHMVVANGGIADYDWASYNEEKYIPVANVNPEYLMGDVLRIKDISSSGAGTENIINLSRSTANSETILIEETEIYDDVSRLEANSVNGHSVDKSKIKSVLPEMGVRAYQLYSIFDESPENFPLKDKTDVSKQHVHNPSVIRICNKGDVPLFGHPLYYEQNLNGDASKKNIIQALLFLCGIDYQEVADIHGKLNDKSVIVPKVKLLKDGAILWYIKNGKGGDICIPQGFKDITDGELPFIAGRNYLAIIPKDDNSEISYLKKEEYDEKYFDYTENQRNALISYFESWAENSFKDLVSSVELRSNKESDFTKLVEMIEEDDSPLFEDYFIGENGSTSVDFYECKESWELTVKYGALIGLKESGVGDYQNKIIKFFTEYCTFIDLVDVKTTSMPKDELVKACQLFKDTLQSLYASDETSLLNETYDFDPNKDADLKLSTYMTLKTLYDKWLCAPRSKQRWLLDDGLEKSEFTHFKFIDSFYREGYNIAVNFSHIDDLASQMMATSNIDNTAIGTKFMGQSLYEFLYKICEKNQMLFLALPMENEFNRPEGIADMFEAKPYSKMEDSDTSTYICIYMNKPSEHLNIEYDDSEYMYTPDGFNIANANGQVLETKNLLPQLCDVEGEKYRIPAFGVTYGKLNQSFFKKISVSTKSPQVTEASIAATQLIASKANEGVNQTALYGQDLYRVYTNYSYTCTVEMMGDAQIMPLTYFQLNNIPLFRGTYMIISVEHSIEAGNMTTKFTGVRMSRFDMASVAQNGIYLDDMSGNYGLSFNYNAMPEEEYNEFLTNYGEATSPITIYMSALTHSDTAVAKGHSNIPDAETGEHLLELLERLQIFQDAWYTYCKANTDKNWSDYYKIHINSGYRDPQVNAWAGGCATSSHLRGYAADLSARNEKGYTSDEATYQLFVFIIRYSEDNGLPWDTIINERHNSRWVHYGLKSNADTYGYSKMSWTKEMDYKHYPQNFRG